MKYDYCIIGGGILGLATAMKLLEQLPGANVVVIEKEHSLASHQSGRNSGVIHAGIYYAPGSLKARLCKRGAQLTKEFCAEHGVPFDVCGKLVVATNELERRRLEALASRAVENQIQIEPLSPVELSVLEPNIQGVAALFVKETGIVDYRAVCRKMADRIQSLGGTLELDVEVTGIHETLSTVNVTSAERTWDTRCLVACAGLQSDRIAKLARLQINHQIVPFRGEYYRLPASKNDIVRHLIYPVPDPDLPFLGVHLTKMIDGTITVGPNAVLGFAREDYAKFAFDMRDVREYVSFPGFWRMMVTNLQHGLSELGNSMSKARYLVACRKYCPGLGLDDLLPSESGIRAQAVLRNGDLIHDFLFVETDRMLHVCNAPSPAATSAIPIAEVIANKVLQKRSIQTF
jgi:L-2-hydroxyglutarate oxidase